MKPINSLYIYLSIYKKFSTACELRFSIGKKLEFDNIFFNDESLLTNKAGGVDLKSNLLLLTKNSE